jgi:hypothetical protein
MAVTPPPMSRSTPRITPWSTPSTWCTFRSDSSVCHPGSTIDESGVKLLLVDQGVLLLIRAYSAPQAAARPLGGIGGVSMRATAGALRGRGVATQKSPAVG